MANRVIRGKDRKAKRLPVDAAKVNMGNSYGSPPEYYYDVEVTCIDCGKIEVWSASQQKWWYEDIGAFFFSTAARCRGCRAKERERKQKARIRSGHHSE